MNEFDKTRPEQSLGDVASYVSENFTIQAEQLDVIGAAEYMSKAITGIDVDGTKVVSVIGGPASGKTRLTEAMIVILTQRGLVGHWHNKHR